MKTILYRANTRGNANHGWLVSQHTFSFANYYNPERMNFGLLRVVNDDTVAGGQGFGTHPHENMEIISIPLSGALEHKDSMGNKHVIESGEVQVMSAGTGITHSEYNANKNEEVKFFQIWVYPREQGVKPRYGQKRFDLDAKKNDLTLVVSPDEAEASLWVHQDVWFSLGNFDEAKEMTYNIKKKGNGAFVMVVEDSFQIGDTKLDKRDAVGISDVDTINIKSLSDDARLLIIDVPMDF